MVDEEGLVSFVTGGGQLSAPDNVTPRYRGELMRLMAIFVDSEMAGASGFADCINLAPGLKERIIATRIVLDKFNHARAGSGPDGAVRRQHRPVCRRPSLGGAPRPQRQSRHAAHGRRHAPQRVPLPDQRLGRFRGHELPDGAGDGGAARRADPRLLPAARRRAVRHPAGREAPRGARRAWAAGQPSTGGTTRPTPKPR